MQGTVILHLLHVLDKLDSALISMSQQLILVQRSFSVAVKYHAPHSVYQILEGHLFMSLFCLQILSKSIVGIEDCGYPTDAMQKNIRTLIIVILFAAVALIEQHHYAFLLSV